MLERAGSFFFFFLGDDRDLAVILKSVVRVLRR